MRIIDRVARPALILSAADDPFVPPEIFDAPAVRNNPHITTVITERGGHCAFVEPPAGAGASSSAKASADRTAVTPNGYDGYFAEKMVVDFLESHLRR
jgi:hypothetical protein